MNSGYDKILWDKYMESSFEKGNILTKEQYEKASYQFKCLYKGCMPREKDASILDIGAGAGHFLFFLKEQGYNNFLGVDISEQQVEFCRENVTERILKADIFDFLSSKKDKYALISAHDVLEHIPKKSVLDLLRLISGSLQPGGKFILRVPNMSNPFSLNSRYCDITHEAGYTFKSLEQILNVAGFKDIEILNHNKIPPKNLKNMLRRVMVNALHSAIKLFYYIQDFNVPECLDKNIVVVAEK